jgi:hypothetical protein
VVGGVRTEATRHGAQPVDVQRALGAVVAERASIVASCGDRVAMSADHRVFIIVAVPRAGKASRRAGARTARDRVP